MLIRASTSNMARSRVPLYLWPILVYFPISYNFCISPSLVPKLGIYNSPQLFTEDTSTQTLLGLKNHLKNFYFSKERFCSKWIYDVYEYWLILMYCLDGKMQHCEKFLQIVQTWLGGNDKSRILFPDCVGMGEEYLQNTCEFGRKLHIHTLYCGLEFSWVPNTAFWEAKYPHHRPSNQEIRNVYSRKGLNQLVLLVGTLASILGF